mgnify:CR=1 FL=1
MSKVYKMGETTWINKDEWDFHTAWRHYKNTIFMSFGPNYIPSKEQLDEFEKYYKATYPSNAEILDRLKERNFGDE